MSDPSLAVSGPRLSPCLSDLRACRSPCHLHHLQAITCQGRHSSVVSCLAFEGTNPPSAPEAKMPGCEDKGHSHAPAMSQPADVLHQPVPRTMEQAMTTFFRHPSPVSVVLGIVALLAARCQYHYTSWWELPVAGCVVGAWLVQEWLVHRKLLHSTFAWFGKDIHINHHNAAYFHVSIDGPELILPAQVLVFALFWTMFEDKAYSLTACATYYTMGLLYLWTHFLVHTHVKPQSALGMTIRRNHMLHHCRSEDFWLSFLAPAVDTLFGTNADPRAVPVGKLAKGHKNAQDMQRHATLL